MKIAVFLALTTLFVGCSPSVTICDLYISNVNLIDVENGKVITEQDVLIINDRITKIMPHQKNGIKAKETVDGTSKYLLPGLWDMHVHIHQFSDRFLPLFLAHGVTGIRDLANIELSDFHAWKKYVKNHEFAPRLGGVAGKIIDGVDFFAKPIIVKDSIEAVQAVDSITGMGGDFIKLYGSVQPQVLKHVIQKAKKENIPFAGHTLWGVDLADQSDMGYKSIEHMEISLSYAKNSEALLKKYGRWAAMGTTFNHIPEFFWDLNNAHRNRDARKMAALFTKLRENQTWQCTAVLALLWADTLDFTEDTSNELGLQYYPDSLAQKHMERGLNRTPKEKAFAVESLEVHMEIVKALYDHKVPLLAGGHPTHFKPLLPGISLHRELMLMQQAGIPPYEVLKTATINPAKFVGRAEELGSIAEGKIADMVLLNGNPLDDISNVSTIHAVLKDGVYHNRGKIDSILKSI